MCVVWHRCSLSFAVLVCVVQWCLLFIVRRYGLLFDVVVVVRRCGLLLFVVVLVWCSCCCALWVVCWMK